MSTFLLEIGTEELPADFARLALPQFESLLLSDLEQSRFGHGRIHCTSTPRRIAVILDDLATKAKDFEETRKGPPASQAFKNGEPTQAAYGFAKRCGISVESLEVLETEKGPFVFGRVVERGLDAIEFLASKIPLWIESLQGSRFMRWGNGERRFSRPIRWIVALFDDQLVPFSLEGCDPGLTSGNHSRGHRLYSDKVLIASANSYLSTLEKVGVEVDRQKRKRLIENAIKTRAEVINCNPDLPDYLLEELTDLVESPLLLEGDIEESFLDIPAEVLSTVMKVHQRYVPLYKYNSSDDLLALDAKESLLPKFFCVSNALESSCDLVRKGNERVLKARLSDAQFFIKVDREKQTQERIEDLRSVTFAEGLGSLYDRVQRMEWIAKVILEQLNLNEKSSQQSLRAVSLSKHDLVSQMVGEFPELQGIIGGKYLLAEGEDREVSLAVLEQYLPRGAGDNLPQSDQGSVLALTDRFELLLSIFAKGERPTGSSDPYALRRAGNGILQILWFKGWKIDIIYLIKEGVKFWKDALPTLDFKSLVLIEDLTDFLCQRILALLDDTGIDSDLAQAVAGSGVSSKRLLSDPLDSYIRANLLVRMRKLGELKLIQRVVVRAEKLANKSDLPFDVLSPLGVVDPGLFEKSSENDLLQVLENLSSVARKSSKESYIELAKVLSSGAPILEKFFDGDNSVMVMVDDLKIRNNRLNMLAILRNQASILADFVRIN